MKHKIILFCIFTLSCQKTSHNKTSPCEYTFYKNYKMQKNYWKTTKLFKANQEFKNGCKLHFSQKTFIAKRVLSAKFSSIIFLLNDDSILRLAKSYLQKNDLKDYYSIYKELQKQGVPVVHTSKDDYTIEKIEYLQHELLEIEYTFKEFIDNRSLIADYNNIFNKFINFAVTLKGFKFIPDLHGENIVYASKSSSPSEKIWIAMDFGASDPDKFINFPGEIFVHYKPKEKNRAIVKALRKSHKSDKDFLDSIKNSITYPNLYNEISYNTITDPDPAIIRLITLPSDISNQIRNAIILKRVKDF